MTSKPFVIMRLDCDYGTDGQGRGREIIESFNELPVYNWMPSSMGVCIYLTIQFKNEKEVVEFKGKWPEDRILKYQNSQPIFESSEPDWESFDYNGFKTSNRRKYYENIS